MMARITTLSMLIAALALAGCLTPQDYTPVAQYTIAPDLSGVAEENGTDATLGIRRFSAAQPLKRDIFYRDPDLRVGNLLDAQWAENPADLMTRFVFDAAMRSGRFKDVGLATDIAPPTYLLTGDLRRFDLDRTGETWAAVCQVHFELRTVSDRAAAWSETLTASVPLARNEVGALPQAMSAAASDVIQTALESIIGASR
jgi:ABC-type uncharacterized transport system auxiliary subunit